MATQCPAQPTVERVHEIALSLFARQGYEGMSLSQLAAEVGIRKPSLYNHIDSKQALFMSLVERVQAAFFEALDTSIARHAEADVHKRLFELVCDLSRFILTEAQGVFYKRYLLFPPEALSDQVRAINADGEARIDAVLHALYVQGQQEQAWGELSERGFLDAFYCLMDGLFSERFIYSGDEYDRRVASIWPIFWSGLTARADR
ncbi:TetR/AcrR family transcriptional regulator [Salinisphaera sp. SPP-AMP-43]|uniref:TetR/AcrR family transcriptional regulator n=1 Tax=Salinisphaera sp. SPP-AMP-43 TaxID=3121288 RepID=UPI003C6DF4EE